MPFSEENYKILKKSRHYINGGRTYKYLKKYDFTNYLYITQGEIHGTRARTPDGITSESVVRYRQPEFKLKMSQ